MKTKHLHIRIDEETKLEAERLAELVGVNVSELIRLIIKQNKLNALLNDVSRTLAVTQAKRKNAEYSNARRTNKTKTN